MFVFSSILVLATFNVILFFTLSHYLLPNHNSTGVHILTFCIMYVAFYLQLLLISNFISFRMFTLIE